MNDLHRDPDVVMEPAPQPDPCYTGPDGDDYTYGNSAPAQDALTAHLAAQGWKYYPPIGAPGQTIHRDCTAWPKRVEERLEEVTAIIAALQEDNAVLRDAQHRQAQMLQVLWLKHEAGG